jgi:hypothetical protein
MVRRILEISNQYSKQQLEGLSFQALQSILQKEETKKFRSRM